MSANLALPNTYYNVSCNQLYENENAYAVCSTVQSSQSISAGSSQLISYNDSASAIFQDITFNSDKTIFTLSKRGVYAVQVEVSVDLPATSGAQATLSLLVNGLTGNGYDVAYASPTTTLGNIKQTIKSFIIQQNNPPTNISVSAGTIVGNATFRYANISIFKIAPI